MISVNKKRIITIVVNITIEISKKRDSKFIQTPDIFVPK